MSNTVFTVNGCFNLTWEAAESIFKIQGCSSNDGFDFPDQNAFHSNSTVHACIQRKNDSFQWRKFRIFALYASLLIAACSLSVAAGVFLACFFSKPNASQIEITYTRLEKPQAPTYLPFSKQCFFETVLSFFRWKKRDKSPPTGILASDPNPPPCQKLDIDDFDFSLKIGEKLSRPVYKRPRVNLLACVRRRKFTNSCC